MVAADLYSTAVWVIHSLPGSYQTGTGTFRLISGLRLSGSKYASKNSIVPLKLLLGFAFSVTVGFPLLKKWLKQHKLILFRSRDWKSGISLTGLTSRFHTAGFWGCERRCHFFAFFSSWWLPMFLDSFFHLQSTSLRPLLSSSHCLLQWPWVFPCLS